MNKWMIASCGIALAMPAVAAEAAVLVVRSSGPSAKAFPAGRALPESQTITLRGNDVVILLDSRGTRTLRGPGTYSTSASSGSSTSATAALSGQSNARRSRVGAVRGAPTGATSGRNVWQADIGRSGNVCIVNPADLGLYRADSSDARRVTVTEIGSNRAATVEFAAGQKNAPWPAAMPVAVGHKYQVKGGGAAVTLNALQIEPVPAGLEGLAQRLIRNDCQGQLDVLIDTFAGPSAS
ncbi:MAG TPA: hypothetical protein VGR05_08920 [Sphingomicrobium sp.]|nr:hypothetical protein [Sphingomicrobium sp.]